MVPYGLLLDPAFWLFGVFYVLMIIGGVYLLLLPQSLRAKRPDLKAVLPKWVAILFAVLLFEQFFHQAEHVTQMYQFAFLGMQPEESHGFLWFLDHEWSHFTFNTIYMLGMTVVMVSLLVALRRARVPFTFANTWIIAVFLLMEGWHIVEHSVRVMRHVVEGCERCPGVLDLELNLSQLPLHFWLNFFALLLPAAVAVWYNIPRSLSKRSA